MTARLQVQRLRRIWDGGRALDGPRYELLERAGAAFVARSPSGAPALVVEVPSVSGAASRTASGCELLAFPELEWEFEGVSWKASAAVLECVGTGSVETFSILAADVLSRVGSHPTWSSVAALVDEWLALLRPRPRLSPERELGLWAELWFVEQGENVDRMLGAWRGPEGDAIDFLFDAMSVELKAGAVELEHHVSLGQVRVAVPGRDAWLLSVWIGKGSEADPSLAEIVNAIESRVEDPALLWRSLARAGLSRADVSAYTIRYCLRAHPTWFAMDDVPAVHVADPGVSAIRYRIALDPERRADPDAESKLWRRSLGRDYARAP